MATGTLGLETVVVYDVSIDGFGDGDNLPPNFFFPDKLVGSTTTLISATGVASNRFQRLIPRFAVRRT